MERKAGLVALHSYFNRIINMNYTTFAPSLDIPSAIITPQQTHSTNISEIKTGKENLENCDGIWTRQGHNFILGVKTADCAAICFYNKDKYGVIHAGWRGLVDGIVEKMCKTFSLKNTQIWVSPLLPQFEISKDECYDRIHAKFGNQFFLPHPKDDNKAIFDFKSALKSVLPPQATFDPRSTFDTPELASWRRDGHTDRNITILQP